MLTVALYAFYKDVDETSVATVLWNLVNWSNTNTTIRINDNAFVFNIMLGYNTAFYCEDTEQWYWDEVNSLAATCYIKFKHEHFEYIQPLRRHTDFDPINKKEQVLPKAKVLSTAPVLEGIVKHIIPLYIHVMDKTNSIVTIHATTNSTKEDEFQIKTAPRLELPLLRIGKGVITDHIDFSFINNDKEYYENKFVVYSRSLSRKYKSLINNVYKHLDLKELTNLKLTVDVGLVANLNFSRRVKNVIKNVLKKRILLNVVRVPIGFTIMLDVIT